MFGTCVALHGVLKFLFLEWYYDTLFDRSGESHASVDS